VVGSALSGMVAGSWQSTWGWSTRSLGSQWHEVRVTWNLGLAASGFGGTGVGVGRGLGQCCSEAKARSDQCRWPTGSRAWPLASGLPSLRRWSVRSGG
jgi:hypothetical protein